MTPEGSVKRAVHEWLIWHGWLVLRINQGARKSEDGKQFARFAFWQALGTDEEMAGIADLLAFKPGYPPYAVECKAPGKRLNVSAKQAAFLDAWYRAGGRWLIAEGVEDLEVGIHPRA